MYGSKVMTVTVYEDGKADDSSEGATFVSVFFFKQKAAYEMLRSLVGSEMCIRDRYFSSRGD